VVICPEDSTSWALRLNPDASNAPWTSLTPLRMLLLLFYLLFSVLISVAGGDSVQTPFPCRITARFLRVSDTALWFHWDRECEIHGATFSWRCPEPCGRSLWPYFPVVQLHRTSALRSTVR
jgi:hypothetical protein